jgi:hypothetical protein
MSVASKSAVAMRAFSSTTFQRALWKRWPPSAGTASIDSCLEAVSRTSQTCLLRSAFGPVFVVTSEINLSETVLLIAAGLYQSAFEGQTVQGSGSG